MNIRTVLGFFVVAYLFLACGGNSPTAPQEQEETVTIVTVTPQEVGAVDGSWKVEDVFKVANQRNLKPFNKLAAEAKGHEIADIETLFSVEKIAENSFYVFRFEVSETAKVGKYSIRKIGSTVRLGSEKIDFNNRTLFVFTR